MPMGSCKLCHNTGVNLQRSHFLPRGVFKSLRGRSSSANPNPLVITSKAGCQTSRQPWAYLLCSKCEQLFSRNGEDWVLRFGLRGDGRFRLGDLLLHHKPDLASAKRDFQLYYAAAISEVDVAAITYFAASMFWRAAVYGWNEDGSFPVQLGPYEDHFRQYLLGLDTFPYDSSLVVSVRKRGDHDQLSYPPITGRLDGALVHRFVMPGFSFTLFVGKQIPTTFRDFCFARHPQNPIFVGATNEDTIVGEIADLFANHLRREGWVPPNLGRTGLPFVST